MRRRVLIIGVLLAMLLGLGVAVAQAKTFHLLILVGQSNAMGMGNGDKLPPEFARPDPRVLQFRVSLERKGQPNPTDHWEPMAPYPLVEPKFDIRRAAFGPEVALSHTVAAVFPGDEVGVVKQAMGGTSVVSWEKNTDRPGWHDELVHSNNKKRYLYRLYANLIHAVQTAAEQAAKRPGIDHVEIDAMFYVQTERDCTTGADNAKAYGPRLEALIRNVRADLSLPDLPVIVADAHSGKWKEDTKRSLREAISHTSHTALASADGLSAYGAVHYDTAGQLELGRRLAKAWLEMKPGH